MTGPVTTNRQGARWRLYADGSGTTRARRISGSTAHQDRIMAGLGCRPVLDYRDDPLAMRSARWSAALDYVLWRYQA